MTPKSKKVTFYGWTETRLTETVKYLRKSLRTSTERYFLSDRRVKIEIKVSEIPQEEAELPVTQQSCRENDQTNGGRMTPKRKLQIQGERSNKRNVAMTEADKQALREMITGLNAHFAVRLSLPLLQAQGKRSNKRSRL